MGAEWPSNSQAKLKLRRKNNTDDKNAAAINPLLCASCCAVGSVRDKPLNS